MTATRRNGVGPAPDADDRFGVADGLDPVVSARNVSKHFVVRGREVPVLHDLSLSVAHGETVSIVGPSGCGKTTLLRMIQGLEAVSSGAITIRGQQTRGAAVDAGFVFQQPSLMPWFTVRRNIEFGLRLRARRGDTTKADRAATVDHLLELVGLSSFGEYHPYQLSGGMQQRVNLARALAVDPAVLLLDEPFSALDTMTRERLQLVLGRSLAELGTTAVLVTHDIREAIFLGDRVVVMGTGGRILSEVPIDEPGDRDDSFQHSTRMASAALEIYSQLNV